MGDILLPPVADPGRLQAELARVPARHREDAIQEAWLAHLENRDAVNAVMAFHMREYRHELGLGSIESDGGTDSAIDTDGKRTELTSETPAPRQSNPRARQPRKLAG